MDNNYNDQRRKKPLLCITRIDYDNGKNRTHGWQVRVQRNKVSQSKLFSDSVYGGKEAALEAAIKYRDEYMASNPSMSRLQLSQLEKRTNTSGVVGVSKVRHVDQRGDKVYEYWYWQAYWTPSPGKHKCVRFSIDKHGEEAAYQMALAARYAGLMELSNE
jgi:hypothetical protein